MRALGKLHEASAILLAAGDLAGVRAIHAAMGVLLEVTGGGTRVTEAPKVEAVVDVRSLRVGPVRRVG